MKPGGLNEEELILDLKNGENATVLLASEDLADVSLRGIQPTAANELVTISFSRNESLEGYFHSCNVPGATSSADAGDADDAQLVALVALVLWMAAEL